MKYSQLISNEIEKGRSGAISTIPLGFNKMGEHLTINKSMYTLIGGNSGTGKTGFTDQTYVLDPYDWYMKNKNESDIKLQIIYRSMERNKAYKLGKWICSKLYTDYGILLDVPQLYGWASKKNHIPDEIYEKVNSCMNYFDEMQDVVNIIDGAENPTGVYNQLVENALSEGRVETKNQYERTYIPQDNKKITLVVLDHIGKLKSERGFNKKENIDKMSELLGICRDMYGYSPVVVSQFNRSLSDSQRARNKEITPEPEDFKDSSNLYEDCDVALALFNPYKYKVFDHMGYDINKFVNERAFNRFRSVTVLKNSYGIDDFRLGMNFIGEVGRFVELPRAGEMNDDVYNRAKNAQFK